MEPSGTKFTAFACKFVFFREILKSYLESFNSKVVLQCHNFWIVIELNYLNIFIIIFQFAKYYGKMIAFNLPNIALILHRNIPFTGI